MKSFRHFGVIVKNIEDSLYFFDVFFGLKVWKREIEYGECIDNIIGMSKIKVEWVKLKSSEGTILELLQYHSHPDIEKIDVPRIGAAHIAITVSNIDSIYEKLTSSGYKCNKPQLSSDGKVKALYCYGPDGITLELVDELHKDSI